MDVRQTVNALENETLSVLATHVTCGERAALIDFPSHPNAGDSFIYLGQQKYLHRLGVTIGYVSDAARYSPSALNKRVPDGPILIQGGGNFGDRWPEMQAMRERVIGDFPDRRIIQLPQSVDFRTDKGRTRAQAVLNAHPRLTLLLRDSRGVAKAAELFPHADVAFCPDTAIGIGVQPAGRPDRDFVLLMRDDSERGPSVGFELPPGASHVEYDWHLGPTLRLAWKSIRLPGRLARAAPALRDHIVPALHWSYERQARLNLAAARALLSRGRVVVTDRLHAVVLGTLMGKPVIAMDNDYGKVSALYEDYLHRFPSITMAKSVDEARACAAAYLTSR